MIDRSFFFFPSIVCVSKVPSFDLVRYTKKIVVTFNSVVRNLLPLIA